MKNLKNIKLLLAVFLMSSAMLTAGNPDRQGEAGAGELLLNPWARSAGLHTINTSAIRGIESMRLNVAGLGRITGKEVLIGNTRLFEGSDIRLNSFGYAQRTGTNGAFGISLVSVNFGDIAVTTAGQPEGTGATYSPSFFNLGLGYSHTYDNKISVGLLFRAVSESLPEVSAFGFAIDAGVQYVSGEKDNFKLGISLRNVGSPMQFAGQGLTFQTQNPGSETSFPLTVSQQSQDFELPSVLNIGLSYDFYFTEKTKFTALGNFTSNAFSRDQIGIGGEFAFNDIFMLRGAYKTDLSPGDAGTENVYTGLSGGATVELPFNDSGKNKIGIDYAYRTTNPFRGTHNISVRLTF